MTNFTFSNFGLNRLVETSEETIVRINRELAVQDSSTFLEAVGGLLKARGISSIAKELGLTREGLYKAFAAGGNPSFKTVLQALAKLGLIFKLDYKPVL
jgi:probable addiction module antidote protein